MTYEEYQKDCGIDKNIPAKIKWSDYYRCCYCPTCQLHISADTKKCSCGQLLIGYFDKKTNKTTS